MSKGQPTAKQTPSPRPATPPEDRAAPALTEEVVREALLRCWGHQACQVNAVDWPEVLDRLMKPSGPSQGSTANARGRQSLKPALDEAVAALAIAFRDGPPADAAKVVRHAFIRLDPEHGAMLAAELTAACGSDQ